jgi:hypothetical protein
MTKEAKADYINYLWAQFFKALEDGDQKLADYYEAGITRDSK